MSENAESPIYTRNSEVIETDVDGEIVLMHPANWDYFEFNAAGSAIWRLLATPSSIAMLADALTAEFEVARETCLLETAALVETMLANDLVRVSRF